MERAFVHVMHDATNMIVHGEDERRLERIRIDAVDVALAVRSIFGDRHPDVPAVVVDAARMILRAIGQLDFPEQLAGGVELEQPATPGTRRTIDREVVERIGHGAVAQGALQHLDRRYIERFTYLDETLRVKCLPVRILSHETKQLGGLVITRSPL
jgi:hypothetical protein